MVAYLKQYINQLKHAPRSVITKVNKADLKLRGTFAGTRIAVSLKKKRLRGVGCQNCTYDHSLSVGLSLKEVIDLFVFSRGR
jgi:hypothetical protein